MREQPSGPYLIVTLAAVLAVLAPARGWAGEAGLVVILHSDVDVPFAKERATQALLQQTRDLLRRHPKTTIIRARVGLGRVVDPVQSQATAGTAERNPAYRAIVEDMVDDPTLTHPPFGVRSCTGRGSARAPVSLDTRWQKPMIHGLGATGGLTGGPDEERA